MKWGAYLFKDKDPAIDQLRTVIRDELGGLSRKHLAMVEAHGGPVVATLDNWFNGDTMQPKNPSLEAAGRAIGYERHWRKMSREAHAIVLTQAARVAKQKTKERDEQRKKARKRNGHKR